MSKHPNRLEMAESKKWSLTTVKMSTLPTIFPKVGIATAFVLFADFAVDPLPAPSEDDWSAEAGVIGRERLAATALRLIRARDLAVPEAVRAYLEDCSFGWAARTSGVVARARQIQSLLAGHGIESVVIKGPGLAVHYRSRLERPFSDIDFLVQPRDFKSGLRVLRGDGFVEATRNEHAWKSLDGLTREAVNLEREDGARVDLHHRLPPWLWSGGVSPESLLGRSSRLEMPDGELVVASDLDNLLVSALHIVSDRDDPGRTLLAWRDLMTMVSVSAAADICAAAGKSRLVTWLSWVLTMLPSFEGRAETLACLSTLPEDLPHPLRLRALTRPRSWQGHPVMRCVRLPAAHAALFLAASLVPGRRRRPWSTAPH
jgi:hypothetical protein